METINTSKMVSLNGMHYHIWKGKMKDLLFVRSLHQLVFASEKPQTKNDEDWAFEHEQVCGYIRIWVDDNVRNLVENEKNAKTLWNTIEKLYASMTGVLNQLSSVGVTFEDEILGLWLLNTLPDSWETFRVSHTNFAPEEKMSFDYAKNRILNEEIRRKTQGTSSQNEVLFREQMGRNPNRGQGNRGKSRSKSKSSKYKDVESHYCHMPGHIKKNCWSLKNKKNGNNKNVEKSEEHGTDRVAAATSDDLVIVSDDHDINLVSSNICWVGYSGAAVHVTPRREFFSTYTVGDFSPLRMGNNGLTNVIGIGNILLKVKNGSTVLLRDVRHAPDVRLNLISIGRLHSDGYGNNFVDGKWKISKWSLILANGSKLKENLYMLEASISDDSVNVVGKQCSPDLWHKRLSHISANGLETLVKKNVLPGAQSSSFEKCSQCLEGKQNRLSSKTNPPHRQPNLLDLVHSDVYGPLKVIRSRDVVFYEDRTIDDIDKAESSESHSHDDLVDLDPSSTPHLLTTVGGNAVEAEM
ncbi:hypothetical protein SASPL_130316 [Salvia splendens]|uniref:GAG-pre-integrase domain-containing protein n=1 Tax=Salvia splendens TaxID=180675 RepID=A0A8X8ZJC2_SALSN|nr:hypothetical protein SASPL_130316 [Salvia splendens]